MDTHERTAGRRIAALTVLILAAAALAAVPAAAQTDEPAEPEAHCVLVSADEAGDGRLVFDRPECFESEEEAEDAIEDALDDLAATDRATARAGTADLVQPMAGSKTLGIHYDSTGGGGSSIRIVGSACTGGYWNAPTTWKNRISSTYNGCARLVHYDKPAKVGMSYTTMTVGQTDNLGWFSNMAESVSYHAS